MQNKLNFSLVIQLESDNFYVKNDYIYNIKPVESYSYY